MLVFFFFWPKKFFRGGGGGGGWIPLLSVDMAGSHQRAGEHVDDF